MSRRLDRMLVDPQGDETERVGPPPIEPRPLYQPAHRRPRVPFDGSWMEDQPIEHDPTYLMPNEVDELWDRQGPAGLIQAALDELLQARTGGFSIRPVPRSAA